MQAFGEDRVNVLLLRVPAVGGQVADHLRQVWARRPQLFNRVIEPGRIGLFFFQLRRRRRLLDGGDVSSLLCHINHRQRADLQSALRPAHRAVVELVESVSLLAALWNERSVLRRDQFVSLDGHGLKSLGVELDPRKTALKLARVSALRIAAIASQIPVVTERRIDS